MIMFLIAATTCVAVVGSVYLAVLSIMDRQHRLCGEKILPKAAAASGVEHWIQGQAIKVCSPVLLPHAVTLQAKDKNALKKSAVKKNALNKNALKGCKPAVGTTEHLQQKQEMKGLWKCVRPKHVVLCA